MQYPELEGTQRIIWSSFWPCPGQSQGPHHVPVVKLNNEQQSDGFLTSMVVYLAADTPTHEDTESNSWWSGTKA